MGDIRGHHEFLLERVRATSTWCFAQATVVGEQRRHGALRIVHTIRSGKTTWIALVRVHLLGMLRARSLHLLRCVLLGAVRTTLRATKRLIRVEIVVCKPDRWRLLHLV